MRLLHLCLLVVLILTGLVCGGCRTESAGTDRMAAVLREYKYTMYTPFRSEDLPGSIFVIAKDSQGKKTEFLVSSPATTFKVPTASLYDPKGSPVKLFDSLNDSFKVSGSIGADFLSVLVGAKLAAEYAREIGISFDDTQIAHRLELAKLAEYQGQLQESVKKALRMYKDRGQLGSAFLVMETLQVTGMKVTVKLKSGVSAEVAAKKIQGVVDLNAKVEVADAGTLVITSQKPLLIGYKAMSFPESIVGTEVGMGPLSERGTLSPEFFEQLKK